MQLIKNPYVVFTDIETTRGTQRMQQLASIACRYDPPHFTEVARFERKIVGGWDHPDVVATRTCLLEWREFLEAHHGLEQKNAHGRFLRVAMLAGHDIRRHDQPHLINLWEAKVRMGSIPQHLSFFPAGRFECDAMDTMLLAQVLAQLTGFNFVNYKLRTVAEGLGIAVEPKRLHDAEYDCEITVEVARRIARKLAEWTGR